MLTAHEQIRILRALGAEEPRTTRRGSAAGILRAGRQLDDIGRLDVVIKANGGTVRAEEAMLDRRGDGRAMRHHDPDELARFTEQLNRRAAWWLAEIADAAHAHAEAEAIHPRVTFDDGPDAPYARMDRVLADARRLLAEARARRAEVVPC